MKGGKGREEGSFRLSRLMVGTEAGGLDGDVRRVVSSEERRVDIQSMNQTRNSQLNDAPVVTFSDMKVTH